MKSKKTSIHKWKKYAVKVQWSGPDCPEHKRWFYVQSDGNPHGTAFRTREAGFSHLANAFGISKEEVARLYGKHLKEFSMQATENFLPLEKLVKDQDKKRKSR